MTREAIEIPRAVNGRESLSPEYFLKSLGKAVCGYWMGFTMQHVLVDAGMAEWAEDRGVEPTDKGRKAFYDLTVGKGDQYVILQTGPHPVEREHGKEKVVTLCGAFGFGCPGDHCESCNQRTTV
jgi:hypothetical protein